MPAPKAEQIPLPKILLYKEQEDNLYDDSGEGDPNDGGSTKLDPGNGGDGGGDGGGDDDDGTVRVVSKDENGNVILDVRLNTGESVTLPNGSIVTANADGTITQTSIPLGEATVTATAAPSTGE